MRVIDIFNVSCLDKFASVQTAKLNHPNLKSSFMSRGGRSVTFESQFQLEWAVGMTTAPRKSATLHQSLKSLIAAGWHEPRLFVEPDTKIEETFSRLPISHRDDALGAFSNWYLGLSELYLRHPNADAYLICQDDVNFAAGLRSYLESVLWPAQTIGVVSLYCPSHEHTPGPAGFQAIEPGWDAWGALAYVFTNPGLRYFLSDLEVLNHRHHGPAQGNRNIDSVVGAWCQRTRQPYFIHRPSLVQHTGRTSTIWGNGGFGGRRRELAFDPTILAIKSSKVTSIQ